MPIEQTERLKPGEVRKTKAIAGGPEAGKDCMSFYLRENSEAKG